jgi:hypothetical protein
MARWTARHGKNDDANPHSRRNQKYLGPATWIFQCNPNDFDIDGYLSFASERILWLVKQNWKKIKPGDQVFIWRAKGNGSHGPSGIVAECRVETDVAQLQEEPNARRFWRSSEGATAIDRRVWLRIARVADLRHILEKDRLTTVSALSRMGPLGFGHATNYRVKLEEVGPLNLAWQQVVRNRSAHQLQVDLENEVSQLEKKTLEALLSEYAKRRRGRSDDKPRRSEASVHVFERDPYVRAISRKRANSRCQVPACTSEQFTTSAGEPYCEVHHLVPLADGGEDTPENAVCVCPNHHRELHVGSRRNELTTRLTTILRRFE